MFTGIIEGRARLVAAQRRSGLFSYQFEFPTLPASLQPGDSIAINGTCLTVTRVDGRQATFDLMAETLNVTTLGSLQPGDEVNFEHAARFGAAIGGHAVSGHIHTTAELIRREVTPNNLRLEFRVPVPFRKYLFNKGYIAVAGASLTVGSVTTDGFTVDLIPETLRLTIFAGLSVGQAVNIEIDTQTQTIVDTLERLLPEYLARHVPASSVESA